MIAEADVALGVFLDGAAERLAAALGLDRRSARLEARSLAAHGLGVATAWLVAHDRDPLSGPEVARLAGLMARRAGGEPVAYIVGEREFFGRPFRVGPAVLIPRPETEQLVEVALERLPAGAGVRVLDIGSGSGCVAITLALERPDWQVTGVDVSQDALAVAQENALSLKAAVEWLAGDLFDPVAGRRFHAVVSNPPYVAAGDRHLEQGDLRFEPRRALAAGPDGLDVIRRLAGRAAAHLEPGGWLILEHGWDQAEPVGRLLADAGFEAVFNERDLAGQARISGGRRPG